MWNATNLALKRLLKIVASGSDFDEPRDAAATSAPTRRSQKRVHRTNEHATEAQPITVLVVEDSEFDFELFKDHLDSVDTVSFDLIRAETLAEAHEIIAEHFAQSTRIDAILLDLTLPDSHGFPTYEKVRAFAAEIPIVILTGLEDRSLSIRALRDGAANYLIKQRVSGDRIAAAIMSALTRR